MANGNHSERIRALEVFRDVHEGRLNLLAEQVNTMAFYVKAIAYLAGVMATHAIGGGYAQALGDILGQLH